MNFTFVSQKNYQKWLYSREQCSPEEVDPRWEEPEGFFRDIHKKAEMLFPEGISVGQDLEFVEYISQSRELLKERKVLFNAGFVNSKRYFASPDILEPAGEGAWNLYVVQPSKAITDESVNVVGFAKLVCENSPLFNPESSGVVIEKCFILSISKFIEEDTPLDEIFNKTDVTDRVNKLNFTSLKIENMKCGDPNIPDGDPYCEESFYREERKKKRSWFSLPSLKKMLPNFYLLYCLLSMLILVLVYFLIVSIMLAVVFIIPVFQIGPLDTIHNIFYGFSGEMPLVKERIVEYCRRSIKTNNPNYSDTKIEEQIAGGLGIELDKGQRICPQSISTVKLWDLAEDHAQSWRHRWIAIPIRHSIAKDQINLGEGLKDER